MEFKRLLGPSQLQDAGEDDRVDISSGERLRAWGLKLRILGYLESRLLEIVGLESEDLDV